MAGAVGLQPVSAPTSTAVVERRTWWMGEETAAMCEAPRVVVAWVSGPGRDVTRPRSRNITRRHNRRCAVTERVAISHLDLLRTPPRVRSRKLPEDANERNDGRRRQQRCSAELALQAYKSHNLRHRDDTSGGRDGW